MILLLQEFLLKSEVSRNGTVAGSDLVACQSGDFRPRRDGESVRDKPVRAAVGGLIWLPGLTRPNIDNVVKAVAC